MITSIRLITNKTENPNNSRVSHIRNHSRQTRVPKHRLINSITRILTDNNPDSKTKARTTTLRGKDSRKQWIKVTGTPSEGNKREQGITFQLPG